MMSPWTRPLAALVKEGGISGARSQESMDCSPSRRYPKPFFCVMLINRRQVAGLLRRADGVGDGTLG